MEKKALTKRLLKGETCDSCREYSNDGVFQVCVALDSGDVDIPKERTCEHWSPRIVYSPYIPISGKTIIMK